MTLGSVIASMVAICASGLSLTTETPCMVKNVHNVTVRLAKASCVSFEYLSCLDYTGTHVFISLQCPKSTLMLKIIGS